MIKNVLLILILISGILSCNPEIPQESKPSPYEDSTMTALDTIILTNLALPKLTNWANFDTATITVFKKLADGTEGKMYVAENAELVVNTIIEIIENHSSNNIDLCFMIDKTGSMFDDIYTMQSSMGLIFSAIKKYEKVNVALVYYGDKNVDGSSWIEIHNFTQDFNKLENNFKQVRYTGGGDTPESVSDAAYKAVNELSWSSPEKRIMILLGDAPTLVPPLADHTIDDIVKQAKSSGIICNYYPVVVGFAGTSSGPVKENLIAGMYPNPASGKLNIVFHKEEPFILEIFDIKGLLIKTEEINSIKYQVDVSEFTNGVYIIRVSKPNGSMVDSQKIIVKK